MKYLAFDTETTLIENRPAIEGAGTEAGGKRPKSGRVLTGPWKTPTLILGSVATSENFKAVLRPDGMRVRLLVALRDPEWHVIGHNLGFDVDVMEAVYPELREPFILAAEAGRLHDTKVLDQLYGLAVGRYDKPKYHPESDKEDKWWADELRPRSLEDIARDYVGMTLSKEDRIRLGFGQFKDRFDQVPEEFKVYALQDAVATLRVFQELERRLAAMGAKNWLSEALQIRAEFVLRDMDKRGVRIDRGLAAELRDRFSALVGPLETSLVDAGLGRWEPVRGTREVCVDPAVTVLPAPQWTRYWDYIYTVRMLKSGPQYKRARPEFHLVTEAIQDALAGTQPGAGAPRRKDGSLSLEYDYWASRVPPDERALQDWLQRTKIEKILTTYLNVYSKADHVFPRWWVLGARSGRMSASCPSVQNVPKHKLGIRALFVPAQGTLFTKADYSAQEMFTLCESMLNMGIKGPLYDALTSGKDMHKYAGALMLNKDIEDITKAERQATKVLNFGVPGGLGADSLAEYAHALYGIRWTPQEAGAHRDKYLSTFDDVNAYLLSMKRSQDFLLRKVTGLGRKDWAKALEVSDWNVIRAMAMSPNPEIAALGRDCERQLTIELPTGFRRGNCKFTEGANCHFQGLAAAVTKEAAFRAFRYGLAVVLIVHDEIVIQSPPERVDQDAKLLEQFMLDAFCAVCPNLGPYAKVEVTKGLGRWGPATGPDGTEIAL